MRKSIGKNSRNKKIMIKAEIERNIEQRDYYYEARGSEDLSRAVDCSLEKSVKRYLEYKAYVDSDLRALEFYRERIITIREQLEAE